MARPCCRGCCGQGHRPDDLIIAERRPERAAELTERYGVTVSSNADAAAAADTVVLVVKPQDMAGCSPRSPLNLRSEALVVPGCRITTSFLEAGLPAGIAVVRVMPNTPALVDEGMSAISPGSSCDEEHLDRAESLLDAVGSVIRVPEKQQDAVTAISGSGPAYLFFVVESMIEAGVHLALPRPPPNWRSRPRSGSAKLLRETGQHPTSAARAGDEPRRHHRGRVAGTRIAQRAGSVLAALEAARDRSQELGS